MNKQCSHGSDGAPPFKEQQSPAQRPSPYNHSHVRFLEQPEVAIIESSWASKRRNRVKMIKQLYEVFSSAEVTDHMLSEAAELFNENYAVWGKGSPLSGTLCCSVALQLLMSSQVTVSALMPGACEGNVFPMLLKLATFG